MQLRYPVSHCKRPGSKDTTALYHAHIPTLSLIKNVIYSQCPPQALSQDHGRPLTNSSKSLAAVVARLERNAANSCLEGEEDLDEDRLAEEGEDADDEDDDMEAEHQQQHHHHQQQQQHFEVDTDCVSEVAAAVVPRVLYEELVHSYRQQEEDMRRLQQELERTRRQLVQQAKKLKEYGSLLTEVKELRDFNRRLQDVLLMRLGSGERPGACTPAHIPLLLFLVHW